MPGANIVQVEFYHLTQGASATDHKRHSKTVIRFFDTDKSLTCLTRTGQRINEKRSRIVQAFVQERGRVSRMMLALKDRYLDRKCAVVRKRLFSTSIRKLRKVILDQGHVATECSDRSFRWVHGNEARDLYERISHASDLSVHIFRSSPLTSPEIERIASLP